MRYFTKKLLMPAIGLASAAFVLPAHAGFSWTFDSNPVQGNCGAAAVGNSCTQSDLDGGTTVDMTATGWASSAADPTTNLEQAILRRYDGLGVNAQGEVNNDPQHSTDANGKAESILYAFTSGGSPVDVIMESVTHGWHHDADFSLLAYQPGAGDPAAPNLTGGGYDDLTSDGWTLVSTNVYDENADGTNTDITASDDANNDYNSADLNSGNVSSSYWLVAVLNSALTPGGLSLNNDYMKIKTLTASLGPPDISTGVPEPSTTALLLAALGALLVHRRKFPRVGMKA